MPALLRRKPRPLHLTFLLLAVISSSNLKAQLTTGVVEGALRDPNGQSQPNATLVITGALHFRTVVQTDAYGAFAVALPYGEYVFNIADGKDRAGVRVLVDAVQIARVDLAIDGAGVLHGMAGERQPGVWLRSGRDREFPDATTLAGELVNEETASATEPLNFTGLRDNRVGVESQRGYSWTDTQYRLMGMNATDSYQPGRPVIAPDIPSVDTTVRSDFAQTAATSYGTEVDLFVQQPEAKWHGTLGTADTGGFLSASNLPPASERGMVQQADRFRWFTRDWFDAGGPVSRWADVFVMGTGQWSQQTVPLAPPGNNQGGRLLLGDVRGRFRAGARDQFDALYSGSRLNVNNWGEPTGMEALVGRRMSPLYDLPGGFEGEQDVGHLDFLQTGWTHRFAEDDGVLQVRYGYSIAHIDAEPVTGHPEESRVDLETDVVTGGPPMFTRAVRSRQSVAGAWQRGGRAFRGWRHQVLAGAGWNGSAPVNRVTIPFNVNLITAGGVPSEVVEFTTPADSKSIIRSGEAYAADRVEVSESLSLDLGILGDFSRGSVPANGNRQFVNPRPAVARPDLIVWNSLSPRLGFAWRVPKMRRLALRGAYFRLYSPMAGRYLDFGNPNSLSGNVYQWLGRNAAQFQPGERGALLTRFGGAYSSISPALRRPHADEFDLGAELSLPFETVASFHAFRRDDKQRIAALDTGVPASAFTPVTMLDPGPDGITGTFDDRALAVYQQNSSTLGKDQFLLTNPPDLRSESTGFVAGAGGQWRELVVHASFTAEKTYGPTNPGNAIFENDPGVVGGLYMDPNATVNAATRAITDRAYVGKMQASYRIPRSGVEIGSTFTYMDGQLFRRELLVSGLAQGPFLLPVGANRAQFASDWNLRIGRDFPLRYGGLALAVDLLNAMNEGRKIQENDASGPAFNLRLPTAIQGPRQIRLLLRYEF